MVNNFYVIYMNLRPIKNMSELLEYLFYIIITFFPQLSSFQNILIDMKVIIKCISGIVQINYHRKTIQDFKSYINRLTCFYLC